MSDRVKLAREIAARSTPRFVDTNPKPKTLAQLKAHARVVANRTEPRFIGPRQVSFIEKQLTKMRGGLTAEQARSKLMRDGVRTIEAEIPETLGPEGLWLSHAFACEFKQLAA
jgi:hypothetical protein